MSIISLGLVVLVEQTAQLRGSASLGVRFYTVVLDEIVDAPITTDTVYRAGKGQGSDRAAKMGGWRGQVGDPTGPGYLDDPTVASGDRNRPELELVSRSPAPTRSLQAPVV